MKVFVLVACLVAMTIPATLSARPNLDPSDPEVVTTPVAAPRVLILGAVNEPGAHAMPQPVTVTEALARAGGRTQAAGSTVIWTHSASGGSASDSSRTSTKLDLEQLETSNANVTLAPGDTIFVPNAEVFYIRGQVTNPGLYVLRNGMTVSQAILLAGGKTEQGSDRTEVRRTVGGKSATTPVKSTDTVEADDTIVVGRRRF